MCATRSLSQPNWFLSGIGLHCWLGRRGGGLNLCPTAILITQPVDGFCFNFFFGLLAYSLSYHKRIFFSLFRLISYQSIYDFLLGWNLRFPRNHPPPFPTAAFALCVMANSRLSFVTASIRTHDSNQLRKVARKQQQ